MADESYRETETTATCSACGGTIVERSFIPYRPAVSRDLFGPGSRNIATERDRKVTGYHCANCDIEYHKIPKQSKE